MANKRALTDAQERQLAADYLAGKGQTVLARRYGVGQVTVRAALARQGVQQRPPAVANAPKADPAEILRRYAEGFKGVEVAAQLGVSPSTVQKFVRRAGAARGHIRYTRFDRAFFDTVDETRAYWAGFLAADGNIVKDTVRIGLAEKDREILEHLKAAARLDQPIRVQVQPSGRRYVHIDVTCVEWVVALRSRYHLREVGGGKARNLVAPDLVGPALQWAFLRGFFDGDGSASVGGALTFTSASRQFIDWVVAVVGAPAREFRHEYIGGVAWSLRFGIRGDVAGQVARFLYAGSTPETRLARKYDRLARWL